MQLVRQQDGNATVELTRDDLLVVNNALNWILHGPTAIEDWEFQTVIGSEREEALRLLDEWQVLFNEGDGKTHRK
jgi:hypothetical protein